MVTLTSLSGGQSSLAFPLSSINSRRRRIFLGADAQTDTIAVVSLLILSTHRHAS